MRFLSIVSLQLSLLMLFQIKGITQSADIILTNGKIFTSDTAKLYVQALAIKDDKIRGCRFECRNRKNRFSENHPYST